MIKDRLNSAINYAYSFVGTPYRWGGENPMTGYDCSGFVQEILRSVGLDPKGDQTAEDLYNKIFSISKFQPELKPGSLVFYGSPDKIKHVAFAVNNFQVIEAGGGNSKTKTMEDAENQNAFVRIRPFDSRFDCVDIRLLDSFVYD
jgi:cell wall-associated NlpC family hydrolase